MQDSLQTKAISAQLREEFSLLFDKFSQNDSILRYTGIRQTWILKYNYIVNACFCQLVAITDSLDFLPAPCAFMRKLRADKRKCLLLIPGQNTQVPGDRTCSFISWLPRHK